MAALTELQLPEYYRARATEYDAIYAKPERQADLRALELFIPPHFAGRHVLEVACGTGYWTQFIAPVAATVTGIDAAPETLAIARARMPQVEAQFQIGDAYALPAFDSLHTGAFAGFWISHVPKSRLRSFLTGLHARLAPGSPVLLLDNRFVAGSSTPIAMRDDDGNSWQDRPLRDGSVHRVLKNFPTEAELHAVVDGIATDVQYRAFDCFWTLHYRCSAA